MLPHRPDDLIDAHCHLADPRLEGMRDALLDRAAQAGIQEFIQGGVGPDDWQRQSDLAQATAPSGRRILKVFGLHPMWIAQHGPPAAEQALGVLQERLRREPPVGLGELGLDHRRQFPASTHALQRELMERQLELPEGRHLPLVLHVVRAHPEALRILEAYRDRRPLSGIVHAFTGGWEIARRYLDLGFLVSVGGKVAFSTGFENLRRAVIKIPPDRLVLETDSPDQPPPAYQGRLNEPASLWEVARAVAALRGESPQALLESSRDNLRRTFRLQKGNP